ncbi:HAD-IA family hydrolase [Priestia sp. SB1]|uniref:HAD family hydrolase n=1 Tax=Priestia sp. SB1 TaxID=3132359 RepID=UPI003170E660
MIKAVIFDFDGLMIDTESLWFDAYYSVAKEEFGIEIKIEEFALAVGISEVPYLELIEKQVGHPIDRPSFLEKTTRFFKENVQSIQPREGVEEYLQYAKTNNLSIGLATSSTLDWVEKFLKQFNFYYYFSVIKTYDIVGTKKPNPKVYLEALKGLGVRASEAIAFEDSLNGYKAATGAGIHTIVVPNRLTQYINFPQGTPSIPSMASVELKKFL